MNISTPSLAVRRSDERRHADHGWLDTFHSFSFADYYDPAHMGFRSLRVINEDRIAPGMGFPMHPHRDMEIFTYVVSGALQHRDSMGNGSVIHPGQIQTMSAGSGVLHSEFNPSKTEPVHLLQIWIRPEKNGLKPGYAEWQPEPGAENQSKLLIISRDGRNGSARLAQDADVYRLKSDVATSITHELATGRGAWLQVIRGQAAVNGSIALNAGDALQTESAGNLIIEAGEGFEALLFDLL